MTYLERIEKTNSIEELRKIAKAVFRNNKIKNDTKIKISNAYHTKRRELYRQFANSSTNKLFKNLLFQINTIGNRPLPEIANIGKNIYEIAKKNMLNSIERDILFRAYKHQKSKHNIIFKNTEGI